MSHLSLLTLPAGSYQEPDPSHAHPSPAGTPRERKGALALALLTMFVATVAAFLG